jgi:hypothetical protein
MQLTTFTAILVAALSASATPLDAGGAPSIIGEFYGSNNQGCNAGDLHYSFEFEQDNSGTCHNLILPTNINIFATNFTANTLTRTGQWNVANTDTVHSKRLTHHNSMLL